jgi:hypothetical protein
MDGRSFDVPEHGIFGARQQFAPTKDLKVDVRPALWKEIAERVFVKCDRERAVRDGGRKAEKIVGAQVLVLRLDAHSRNACTGG